MNAPIPDLFHVPIYVPYHHFTPEWSLSISLMIYGLYQVLHTLVTSLWTYLLSHHST